MTKTTWSLLAQDMVTSNESISKDFWLSAAALIIKTADVH